MPLDAYFIFSTLRPGSVEPCRNGHPVVHVLIPIHHSQTPIIVKESLSAPLMFPPENPKP